MAINPLNIGLSAGANLTQGYSSGGSVNSAQSQSWSNTAGREASRTGATQAALANNTAQANWEKAAEYNAEQARIQREWQERMANTVYQRTVKDMQKAGINPILATNMGLGTASVGSGATASMSDANAFMGQTFAEQNSASTSQSSGSSWEKSENGIATLARDLGTLAQGLIDRANSSSQVNIAINALQDWANSEEGQEIVNNPTIPVKWGQDLGSKVRQGIINIRNIFKKK